MSAKSLLQRGCFGRVASTCIGAYDLSKACQVRHSEALQEQAARLQAAREALKARRKQLLEETEARAVELKRNLVTELDLVHQELCKVGERGRIYIEIARLRA